MNPSSPLQKVTLDHSLWFYDHDFDCSEWILFVVSAHPVLGAAATTACIDGLASSRLGPRYSVWCGEFLRPILVWMHH
jgi:hypothetical protein